MLVNSIFSFSKNVFCFHLPVENCINPLHHNPEFHRKKKAFSGGDFTSTKLLVQFEALPDLTKWSQIAEYVLRKVENIFRENEKRLVSRKFLCLPHFQKPSCSSCSGSINTVTPPGNMPSENTVGKGEIARNEQFLLYPQYFLPV